MVGQRLALLLQSGQMKQVRCICQYQRHYRQPLAALLFLAPVGFDQATVTDVQARYFLLDWDVPSSANGIIIRHRVFVNGIGRGSLSGSQFRTNVTGLMPFTVYLVEVEACNTAGCVLSDPVSVRTAEAGESHIHVSVVYCKRSDHCLYLAPEGVSAPVLTSVSSRSVVVQWSAPNSPNGMIVIYHIQRALDNMGSVPITVRRLSTGNLTTLVYLDSSGGLTPFTSYLYRIIAENSAGISIGPYANVTTREAGEPILLCYFVVSRRIQ